MQAAFARLAALWYGLGSCSRTVVVDKDLCSMYIIPLFTVLFNSVTISIQSSEVQKHRRGAAASGPRPSQGKVYKKIHEDRHRYKGFFLQTRACQLWNLISLY